MVLLTSSVVVQPAPAHVLDEVILAICFGGCNMDIASRETDVDTVCCIAENPACVPASARAGLPQRRTVQRAAVCARPEQPNISCAGIPLLPCMLLQLVLESSIQ